MNGLLKKAVAAAFTLSTILSAAVMPQTASAATTYGREMITDGGFEAAATGTTITNDSKAELYVGNGTAEVVNEFSATGNQSVKLTPILANNSVSLNFNAKLTKGNYYKISAKIYYGGEKEKGGLSMGFGPGAGFNRWGNGSADTKAPAFFQDDFAALEGTLIAPESGDCRLNINLIRPVLDADGNVDVNNNECVYVDDFSCIEYTPEEYDSINATAKVIFTENFDSMADGTEIPYEANYGVANGFHRGNQNTTSAVTGKVYRGTSGKSVKVTATVAKNMPTLRRVIKLSSGKDYLISAWIRADEGNSVDNIDVNAYLNCTGATPVYTNACDSAKCSKDGQWKKIEYFIHIPADKNETLIPAGWTFPHDFALIFNSGSLNVGDSYYVDDVTVTEAHSDYGNAAFNSGFELSETGRSYPYVSQANRWRGQDFYTQNTVSAVASNEEAHNGAMSLKIEGVSNSGNEPAVVQNVPVVAGVPYEFSAWVKPVRGKAETDTQAGIILYAHEFLYSIWGSGAGDSMGSSGTVNVPIDGEWHKVSTTFTATETTPLKDGYLMGKDNRVKVAIPNNAICYIDDIEVKSLLGTDKNIEGNLITDAQLSDFESEGLLSNPNLAAGENSRLTYSTNSVHSGKMSLGIASAKNVNNEKQSATITTGAALQAGKTYAVGAWMGANNFSGTKGTAELTVLDDNVQVAKASREISNNDANYTIYYFTPEKDVANAKIGISYLDGNPGNRYLFSVDGLFLREVDASSVPANNLIKNGTYEGNVLSDFNNADYSIREQSNVKASIAADYAASGVQSLKVVQTVKGGSIIFAADAKEGGQYKVSCDVRWSDDMTDKYGIYIRKYGPDATFSTGIINGADGWQHLEMETGSIQEGNKWIVKLQIKGLTDTANPTTGTYYIDNLVIQDLNTELSIDSASLDYSEDGVEFTPVIDRTDLNSGYYMYTVTASNPTAEDVNVTPIIALYNANGELANLNIAEEGTTVPAGASDQEIQAYIELPAPEQGMHIKTFLWDTAAGMIPLKTSATKVLIIGNSITQHDRSDTVGWNGTWGMAASSADKDYVHMLQSAILAENQNVEFKWKNVSDFEKSFYDLSKIDDSKYKDLVDYDADVIIASFGANIKNGANEGDDSYNTDEIFNAKHFTNIVDYFNPNGDAQVIVCLTPLTSLSNNTIITQAANQNNWALVDTSDLVGDEYTAKGYYTEYPNVFASDVSKGVLGHPGDKAMAVMAERLAPVVKAAIAKR